MSLREPRVVFLTGATGFIGSAVLERLRASNLQEIACLVRNAVSDEPGGAARGTRVTRVHGDLTDVASYASALARADTVVHLAAAVGAANDAELERVNVIATRQLVDAARAAGVGQILFMSSIAAKARDTARYPYARAKIEGERLVARSGLRHAILRPTIVLGEGGGNFPMLRKLANLPLVPAFGGGTARVQPIDVADVARAVEITLAGRATETLVELGGPEVLTFAELLARIRLASGRKRPAILRVPYEPARAGLALLGKLSGGKFPVRAAQLTPFVEDGVATHNSVLAELAPTMMPLDRLLGRLVRGS
jgi:NADH dehydrogenase